MFIQLFKKIIEWNLALRIAIELKTVVRVMLDF
jgi:hypothetical protein